DLETARLLAIAVHRLQRVARDDEASVARAPHRLDRGVEALVGTDHAEREHGTAVVTALGIAREHRVRDHARVDAEGGERLAPALAVHDDAVEAVQQPPPEILLPRRPTGEQIMRGEDGRRLWAQQADIELGDEPLDVQNVAPPSAKREEPER